LKIGRVESLTDKLTGEFVEIKGLQHEFQTMQTGEQLAIREATKSALLLDASSSL
jgi:hypothetical protein